MKKKTIGELTELPTELKGDDVINIFGSGKSWEPTMRLRYLTKEVESNIDPFYIKQGKTYSTSLQQLWISSAGKTEWRSIESVKE